MVNIFDGNALLALIDKLRAVFVGRAELVTGTAITGMNADMVDGLHAAVGGGANTVVATDGSGYVGIGTTGPQSSLHVEGSSQTTNLIASSGNGFFRIADSATSGTRKEFTITLDNTNNRVNIQAIQQGVAGRNITLNADGGNVGIGTTTVPSLLTVAGLINMKGYTVAGLPGGTLGDIAYATDLLAPGFLVAAAGGGVVKGPVFRNVTTWVAF
jgi:hypothetical protein